MRVIQRQHKNKLIQNKLVKEDIKLVPKQYIPELKQHLRTLQEDSDFGEDLWKIGECDLTGCKKIYFGDYTHRIVYEVHEGTVEIVEIVAIGKREKEEVYWTSFKRRLEKSKL